MMQTSPCDLGATLTLPETWKLRPTQYKQIVGSNLGGQSRKRLLVTATEGTTNEQCHQDNACNVPYYNTKCQHLTVCISKVKYLAHTVNSKMAHLHLTAISHQILSVSNSVHLTYHPTWI